MTGLIVAYDGDTSTLVGDTMLAAQRRGMIDAVKFGLPGAFRSDILPGNLADFKFCDTPDRVAKDVAFMMHHFEPAMFTIHASGGADMMRAAVAAARDVDAASGEPKTLVLAVTVLTSLNDDDLGVMGVSRSTGDHTLELARLALSCDVDGVVCSGEDLATLRFIFGDTLKYIVPGVRLIPGGVHDAGQKRIVTPYYAKQAGADYIVVGRPITASSNPLLEVAQYRRALDLPVIDGI